MMTMINDNIDGHYDTSRDGGGGDDGVGIMIMRLNLIVGTTGERLCFLLHSAQKSNHRDKTFNGF